MIWRSHLANYHLPISAKLPLLTNYTALNAGLTTDNGAELYYEYRLIKVSYKEKTE